MDCHENSRKFLPNYKPKILIFSQWRGTFVFKFLVWNYFIIQFYVISGLPRKFSEIFAKLQAGNLNFLAMTWHIYIWKNAPYLNKSLRIFASNHLSISRPDTYTCGSTIEAKLVGKNIILLFHLAADQMSTCVAHENGMHDWHPIAILFRLYFETFYINY